MNNGRWYPTSTTLPNGDVLAISGTITSGHYNVEPQVWQSATGSWRNLSAAHLALPFYPYMFAAPNGKVFCAGPSQPTRYLDITGTGDWSFVANSNYGTRNWGSAVMYDDGKVLIMGGSPCGFYVSCTTYPTATAEIIDLNSPNPVWTYTGSMVTGGRKLHNATLLADGKVLVTGGSRGTESPNQSGDQSSIRMRALGSGDRHVDNDGEPDQDSSLSFHRGAVARRARIVRGQSWRSFRRNLLASVPVPWLASNYYVSTHERWVRGVVFCGHTRCRKHFKCHTNCAFFRHTRLQHGPAHQPTHVLSGYRRSERDGSFRLQQGSARLLHAVYPEFEWSSVSGQDCANWLGDTYAHTDCESNPNSYGERDFNTDPNSFTHSHANPKRDSNSNRNTDLNADSNTYSTPTPTETRQQHLLQPQRRLRRRQQHLLQPQHRLRRRQQHLLQPQHRLRRRQQHLLQPQHRLRRRQQHLLQPQRRLRRRQQHLPATATPTETPTATPTPTPTPT